MRFYCEFDPNVGGCGLAGGATHHEEGPSVVILLEELVFSFGAFIGDNFAIVAQLSPTFLVCHVVELLNFSLLSLHPGWTPH